MINAPIAVIAFKRPDHLKVMLESLSNNKGFNDSNLYIFLDGPKTENDKSGHLETVAVAKNFEHKNKEVIIRDKNLGNKKNVIFSVTEVLKKHDRVICLEDDLKISRYFLKFMNNSLETYKDDKELFHINGWAYPQKINFRNKAIIGTLMCPWGWGTWKNRWDDFAYSEFDKNHFENDNKDILEEFNYHGTHNFYMQLYNNDIGKIDTWDIYWYQYIFLQKGLTIFPTLSHTQNTGFDGSGDNAGSHNDFDTPLAKNPTLKFQKKIKIDAYNKFITKYFYRKIFLRKFIEYHYNKRFRK